MVSFRTTGTARGAVTPSFTLVREISMISISTSPLITMASPARRLLPSMSRWTLAASLLLGLGSGSSASAQDAIKSPIHGLVTMGRMDFIRNALLAPDNSLAEANAHPNVYAGVVLLATWSQLEPSPGNYDFQAIDQGLVSVRTYNDRHPDAPLVAKLRISPGIHVPAWVKQVSGGAVVVTERETQLELARFWSEPYRAAWRKLQDALASRYDTNPLVEEVAISS